MARQDVQTLYRDLKATTFSFVPRGEHHVHDVYTMVKRRFPRLCDDSFLCAGNCARGHEQPEWQHVVRKALQALKSSTGPVSRGASWGHWRFR